MLRGGLLRLEAFEEKERENWEDYEDMMWGDLMEQEYEEWW